MDNINTLDELFEKWIEKQNEENPETYLPKEIPAYSFDKTDIFAKMNTKIPREEFCLSAKKNISFGKQVKRLKLSMFQTL